MKKLKHFIRDIIIFFISITGISYLYRRRVAKKGPLVRVIAFHHIKDAEWFGRTIEFLTTEFHVITPEEFHQKQFDKEKINILITFDDGYASWTKKALPVLEKYGVKAVFFVISGLLEVAKDREERRRFFKERLFLIPKAALTWPRAEMLVESGQTIGGHTVTHPNLAELETEEIEKEIAENKRALESHLGVTAVDFAYPFGRKYHYTDEAREIAKKCGYAYLHSAETGFYRDNDDEIPRTLIERGQNRASIKRWIMGGYDMFKKIS